MNNHKHKKFEGKSGETWIVRTSEIDVASHLHITDTRTHTYGPRGYGGSVLTFDMEDGSIYKAKGPWHSNSEAFFKDTGILISDLCMSKITLREGNEHGKLLYEEKEYVLGPFMRSERIAQQLANITGKQIWVHRESKGGSSTHYTNPGKMPHPMAMRAEQVVNEEKGYYLPYDEAWKEHTTNG